MTTTPPPAPPAYSAQPVLPRTNVLAIIALVLGIFVPIGGIICGHIALGQIKRTGEAGHGLALVGTIIGYAFTIIGIVATIAYIVFVVAIVSAGSSFNN